MLVLHGDTDMLPAGQGTFASRGLTIGSAVYWAAGGAPKMAGLAARFLECPSEAIVFQDGRVFDQRYPDQALMFSQVAAAAYRVGGYHPAWNQGWNAWSAFCCRRIPRFRRPYRGHRSRSRHGRSAVSALCSGTTVDG